MIEAFVVHVGGGLWLLLHEVGVPMLIGQLIRDPYLGAGVFLADLVSIVILKAGHNGPERAWARACLNILLGAMWFVAASSAFALVVFASKCSFPPHIVLWVRNYGLITTAGTGAVVFVSALLLSLKEPAQPTQQANVQQK